MDLTCFVELRDSAAILIMFQTGIPVGTLAKLENKHVNLEAKLMKIDGGIIKNHQSIYLPFDDILASILDRLMQLNELIRSERKVKNEYLLITKNGGQMAIRLSNNNITKRLCIYAKQYGLKNINPHSLR